MRRVSSPSFVGRAEELAAFDSALARAAAGEPRVLLVAGESGVGKTRFVGELAERARAAGARVLTGECVELAEGELPYAPIVAALRDLARDLGGAEALGALAGGARSELALLLPEAGGGGDLPRKDSYTQGRLFDLLLTLFGRLADEQPLVLCIEDLHWADRSTRDLLAFLSRAARDEPLLILATYRSDELHRRHPLRPLLAELERLERTERIELRRFSREELVEQLTGILGERPDPRLADALFERSEGNAFFAEELLAAAGGETAFGLPETLRDALMVRVEALPARARELLRLVSAAGRDVTHRLLAEVAELDEAELNETLRDAIAHQVLVGRDEGYAFRHALMREAVYDDLLPGERGALHVKLAEALERDPSLSAGGARVATELAWHWYQAHDLPRALRAALDASAEAERMQAPAEATRQLENAIELWERVPDPEALAGATLAELLLHAAELAYLAGDGARAVPLARRGVDLLDPDVDRATVAARHERLARYLWSSGRDRESAEVYAHAMELVADLPPSPERARVLAAQAQVTMLLGRPRESIPIAEEAVAVAREVGDRATEGHALNTLGVDKAVAGRFGEGIELVREALEIARELSMQDDLHRGFTNLSDILDQSGRVEEGAALAEEGFRVLRELGGGRGAAFLLAEAAGRRLRLGQVAKADALTRRALDSAPAGLSEGFVREMRSRLELVRGELDAAERQLREGRRAYDRTVGSMWLGPLFGSMANLALQRGEVTEVRRVVAEAREAMDDEYAFYCDELYLAGLSGEADAAERARALGDADGEREALERGGDLLERLRELTDPGRWGGSPPPQVAADLAVGEAEGLRLRGEPSAAAWKAAEDLLDDLGNVLAASYVRLRRAEALLDSEGDRAGAAGALRRAHADTSEVGATRLRSAAETLARRARIELGEETGTAAEDRPLGLTERELEVLLLVADGKTNRQIGAELYMSEKTASVHVSRILAKLEVSTRGEAAAVAHRLGLAGA